MMNKKSFFLGAITGLVAGIILTLMASVVFAYVHRNSGGSDSIDYLERPVSYENKHETSFKVFQVLGGAALATEASDKIGDRIMYNGNTVMILGEDYYNDQIVTVKNPQRVGSYSYTTNGGMPMTVPVIEGEMK